MDYLYSANFKMAVSELNYVFTYYSASWIDGDNILISKPIFFSMMNPMMTLKNPYDSWLAVFEINRNDTYWSMGSIDPTCTRQESMKSYFVTGTYPNMKRGCYHHQIGMYYLYDAIFKMADSAVK